MAYKSREDRLRYALEYRTKNRLALREKGKEYYLRNKERIDNKHKAYAILNKEKGKEWRIKNKERIRGYWIKSKKAHAICAFCGNDFLINPSLIKEKNYCSKHCSGSALAKKFSVKKNKLQKPPSFRPYKYKCNVCNKEHFNKKALNKCCRPVYKIIKRCPVCFSEFKTYKSRPKKYCSGQCHRKAQSLFQKGENSHFWKGGKVDQKMKIRTHALYREWRDKVFKRDNFTCQSCLTTSSEIKRGKLAAHHIIPFSENPKTRLKVSNGITLCWQCHKDYHKYVKNGKLETAEASLTDKVREYLKKDNTIWMTKIHGHELQASGLPDYLGVVAGRFTAIELKVYPNFLTPLQLYTLKKIKEKGGAVFVCRSMDEFKRAILIIKEAMSENNEQGTIAEIDAAFAVIDDNNNR